MRPPRRHRARHLATFPVECSVLRSRGGAIVTRCPACNRRADKSRRGRTEKYREVQGEKYELQNMDAHHRSNLTRRAGDSGPAGGAGSNSTATPVPSLPDRGPGHVRRAAELAVLPSEPPRTPEQSRDVRRLSRHACGSEEHTSEL